VKDVNKWLAVMTLAVACGACAGTDSTSSTEQSDEQAVTAPQ
jgi:hypothetical protein